MAHTDSQTSPPAPPSAAEQIEVYFQKGWTDGLPVVPPTAERIQACLDAARLKPGDVLAELPQRAVRITADKVAVNAVLAGCLPEYMPVVAAAVRGLGRPEFGFHHVGAGTSGPSIAVIVNGPIVQKLGINAKDSALGPNPRPNATIGRALRLVVMNAANTRPGGLDRGTLGGPGRYTLCFAEDEQSNPWEPLHVHRGCKAEESTVSLFATNSINQIYNNQAATPDPILRMVAESLSQAGSIALLGKSPGLVIFALEHGEVIRKSGWSRRQVQQFVFEHARRTIADLKRMTRVAGEILPEDERTWHQAMEQPEDLTIVFAGGIGSWSACMPGFGSSRHSGQTPPILIDQP